MSNSGTEQANAGAPLAIEAARFGLAFPGTKRKEPLQVLKNLNLSVMAGEILTVIGPSGCGKTTLLRAVAGLLTEDDDGVILQGDLRVHGLPPAEAKKQRIFAFTFQNPVLLPWRSVRDNVMLPLEIAHGATQVDTAVADDMLSMVGIREFGSSMTAEISGGMQQRVNLARALVQEPSVLLMDEPFGSLDEVTRERLNFELLRIQRVKKQTVLFVTHSISEAVLLADRVLVLSKRPSRIREEIRIDLGEERTEETLTNPDYLSLVRKVRGIFSQEENA